MKTPEQYLIKHNVVNPASEQFHIIIIKGDQVGTKQRIILAMEEYAKAMAEFGAKKKPAKTKKK